MGDRSTRKLRSRPKAYDHDFASFAEGVVIPHAIYDLQRNTGYINLGTSKDTSEFACDSLRNWKGNTLIRTPLSFQV